MRTPSTKGTRQLLQQDFRRFEKIVFYAVVFCTRWKWSQCAIAHRPIPALGWPRGVIMVKEKLHVCVEEAGGAREGTYSQKLSADLQPASWWQNQVSGLNLPRFSLMASTFFLSSSKRLISSACSSLRLCRSWKR